MAACDPSATETGACQPMYIVYCVANCVHITGASTLMYFAHSFLDSFLVGALKCNRTAASQSRSHVETAMLYTDWILLFILVVGV
jgi:hypothetical protein